MVRATIQPLNVKLVPYDLAPLNWWIAGEPLTGTGNFSCVPMGQFEYPVELPNLKSMSWSRSVDADVASATIVLWNTEILPLGTAPDDTYEFDVPGYFTFQRGAAANPWGHTANAWQDLIAPDRIVRTYEGYGFDANEPPETDPNLYPSGVWMIDEVNYSADGLITLTCRDIGRVLIDQIMFTPVVPFAQYPLLWARQDAQHVVDLPDITTYATSSGWKRPVYSTDSNIPYIGKGFTDGPRAYVESDGSVLGHNGRHAFDTSRSSFWLSVGNEKGWSSAYEFVQGNLTGTVNAVKVYPWGGPYTVYISVRDANGNWLGKSRIPYRARVVDTNADIPYVAVKSVPRSTETTISLGRDYAITAVRVTFSNLYDSNIGAYQYRAGCYDVQCAATVTTTGTEDGGQRQEGNYADYTDIVKWLCAWGGFYWPRTSTGFSIQTYSDGTVTTLAAASDDPIFPQGGNVWGDWEQTGTGGKVDLGVTIWDKKPLLDGISYIRDIVNFIFFIDETGGVVWRSPNIWQEGNYISPLDGGPIDKEGAGRTATVYTIADDQVILGLTARLSSKNVREHVFVANVNGQYGAVAGGYNPVPSGLRRVAGWTDQNFETEEECQIMADLITVRQMFRYRQDSVTIPGFPGIQIDDQVQLAERVTSDTYLHYVSGINSEWDAVTGRWTYTLTTNWLGDDPFTNTGWLDTSKLSQATIDYLASIGKL
jgi:hypothetical protein